MITIVLAALFANPTETSADIVEPIFLQERSDRRTIRPRRSSPDSGRVRSQRVSYDWCEKTFSDAYRDKRPLDDELKSMRTSCGMQKSPWYSYYMAYDYLNRADPSDGLTTQEENDLQMASILINRAIDRGHPDKDRLFFTIQQANGRQVTQNQSSSRAVQTIKREEQLVRISGAPSTTEAKRAFEAAKTGDVDAMIAYAKRLATGRGVRVDQRAANTWLDSASKQGSTDADVALARRIYLRHGSPPNRELGLTHAGNAVRAGDLAGYFWRAVFTWPGSDLDLGVQMAIETPTYPFNMVPAIDDLDLVIERCKARRVAMNPKYNSLCQAAPIIRKAVLADETDAFSDVVKWEADTRRLQEQEEQIWRRSY